MAFSQFLSQKGEPQKQFPSGRSFENFNSHRYSDGRWKGDKQVKVIWLNLFGNYRPPIFLANRVQQVLQFFSDLADKNGFSIFWTPHHMVCCLIYAVPFVNYIYHVHLVLNLRADSKSVLRRSSIPLVVGMDSLWSPFLPRLEIAGFLETDL